MKLTIYTAPTMFGAEATEGDAELGADYMRRVAQLLGLQPILTHYAGTDQAQEIWADETDGRDVGELAFDAWCRGLSVERGACLCAPQRVPGPIIRRACRDAKPMHDGLDAERRLLAVLDAMWAAGLDREEARQVVDDYFAVSPGDRRGLDVRHRRGRWCLVTTNGTDRIVRA